ncbi:LysR substrate-binding domain-containing protein [Vogesella sp. GCM10023246]|uniref:LysR substrate-binding domain-containing protein n=1 Tax=Vogesella oryzagri TaxID=3160864 RepID=A0ABV1LZF4_9NEIS
MKFQQISAFKAVIELGTVTAAANYLHIAQPAVSRLIASLEEAVGFPLFERIKGRLQPTSQGRAFYLEVDRAFVGLERLRHSASSIRQQHSGSLVLAAMPLLSNLFLPEALRLCLQQGFQGAMTLQTFRSEEVLQRVAIQTCDIGFALGCEAGEGMSGLRVRCDSICLLPPAHPLAQLHRPLTPGDLAGTALIRNEQDPAQQLLDHVFRQAGMHRHDPIEVSFASALASLVAVGVGAAVTDPFTAHIARNQNEAVTIHRFEPALPFEFLILLPTLRPLAPFAQHFLRAFFELAREEGILLQVEYLPHGEALFGGASPWLP